MRESLVNTLIDIEDDIWTISNTMRDGIYRFFKNKTSLKIAELGAYKGYTTRFLAQLFNYVYAVDINDGFLEENQDYNNKFRNIDYIKCDLYNSGWENIPRDVNVVFIDAYHEYENCRSDLDKSLEYFKDLKYIIFDNYGVFPGVKKVVDDAIEAGVLKFECWIGLTNVPTVGGKYVKGVSEGVICSKVIG